MVAGDLYPVLSNVYPEILAPWVREVDFRRLIEKLNALLAESFAPRGARAWMDMLMGLVTGWLWEDLGLTRAKRGAKEMESVVASWNEERLREDRGRSRSEGDREEMSLVQAIDLRRTGFLCLDIVIPDPKVVVVVDEKNGNGSQRSGGAVMRSREATRPGTGTGEGVIAMGVVAGKEGLGGRDTEVEEEEEGQEDAKTTGFPKATGPDTDMAPSSRRPTDATEATVSSVKE